MKAGIMSLVHFESHNGSPCCGSSPESCLTLCDPIDCTRQASLSIIIYQGLLKLMSMESMMPSNHRILCPRLLLLPAIFPSIRVFSNESALHIMRLRYESFSFSISPSSEYSGFISFRNVWFNCLALQRTLKSLFQHHSPMTDR